MSTMAEIQVRLGCRPARNILPCDRTFPVWMRRAERDWGAPLPGWVTGIQLAPFRLEIAGQPPIRLLRALQLPIMCAQVAKFWQLRPVDRVAAVYHWRLGWQPLPAMPAGISFPGGDHPCFRAIVDWDTGEIRSWRVYAEEWSPGQVAGAWPELVDPAAPEPGWEQLFGIDYGPDLQVTGITRYDYPIDSLTPAMLEQSRLRLAVKGAT